MIMHLDHINPPGGQVSGETAVVRVALKGMEVSTVRPGVAGFNGTDAAVISETGQNLFEMDKIKADMQEYAGWGNFNIDFALDDETGSLVISIIDRDTGEIMRQIPPDEILALRSHLQELLEDASAESA